MQNFVSIYSIVKKNSSWPPPLPSHCSQTLPTGSWLKQTLIYTTCGCFHISNVQRFWPNAFRRIFKKIFLHLLSCIIRHPFYYNLILKHPIYTFWGCLHKKYNCSGIMGFKQIFKVVFLYLLLTLLYVKMHPPSFLDLPYSPTDHNLKKLGSTYPRILPHK